MAEDTKRLVENQKSLDGKVFIITGSNRGFGYEVTRSLVKEHACVVMACRDANKAYSAISKIRLKTTTGNLHFIPVDLTSVESIANFTTVIKQTYPKIDCIIANAAVKFKKNEYSQENLEINFATNYLGHFILIQLLLKKYMEYMKIVLIASTTHHKGRIDFRNFGKCVEPLQSSFANAYFRNSKLAIMYFGGELYRRGYDVHITCPDDMHTEMFKGYKMKWYDYILNHPASYYMLKSSEETVANIIYCATENTNTDRKNPLNGYLMVNRRRIKSKIFYSELISKMLWEETIKLCEGFNLCF